MRLPNISSERYGYTFWRGVYIPRGMVDNFSSNWLFQVNILLNPKKSRNNSSLFRRLTHAQKRYIRNISAYTFPLFLHNHSKSTKVYVWGDEKIAQTTKTEFVEF